MTTTADRTLVVAVVALLLGLAVTAWPAPAPAQKLPDRFCPGLKAISRNSATDRTGTPWNTYHHVAQIEEHYWAALEHRCLGVLSAGLRRAVRENIPSNRGHDWEVELEVLARDVRPSYVEERLFIDGVRLVLRTVAKGKHLV